MNWTTEEGKQLKICEMKSSHIFNCIRMLERVGCRGNKKDTLEFLKKTIPGYQALCDEFKVRLLNTRVTLRDLMLAHIVDGTVSIDAAVQSLDEIASLKIAFIEPFNEKYAEELRKCESVQRLISNVCGKLDNYFDTINNGVFDTINTGVFHEKIELGEVKKVRRELSNLGLALDALHRAFIEGERNGTGRTETEENKGREVKTPRSSL